MQKKFTYSDLNGQTKKSNFELTLHHNESLSSEDLIQGKNDFSSEEDRLGE